AVELAPESIRVNLIAPDTTPSETSLNARPPEVRAKMGATTFEQLAKTIAVYVPSGSAPPADHLGDAVLFLASDLSAYTTGAVIPADGGLAALR
ncbi:MAG: SDR family oxidoreductase, partial [Acidimicrobiia bacterium]